MTPRFRVQHDRPRGVATDSAGGVKAQLVGACVLGAGALVLLGAAALSDADARGGVLFAAALVSAALVLLLMYGLVVAADEERGDRPDA